MFRLQTLSQRGLTDRAFAQLKRTALKLDGRSNAAIVKFLKWLPNFASGATTNVTLDHISKIVAEIVRGWWLRPYEPLSYSDWATMADNFVVALGATTSSS